MSRYDPSPNWGGARAGAGRQRTGRYTRSVFVTDAEFKMVLVYIQSLRKAKK